MTLSHPQLRTNRLSQVRSWLWTIPVAMLTTAVLISAAVGAVLVAPGGRRQQWFQHKWGAAVLGIVGARVKVRGVERIDVAANYVVAANHASLMDIAVLFGWLPMPFKFLAKRELLNVPFIGWYLRRDGHLTVDRKSLRSSIESTNQALARRRTSALPRWRRISCHPIRSAGPARRNCGRLRRSAHSLFVVHARRDRIAFWRSYPR